MYLLTNKTYKKKLQIIQNKYIRLKTWFYTARLEFNENILVPWIVNSGIMHGS